MIRVSIIAALALAPMLTLADVACFDKPPESVDIDEKYESARVVFVATVTRDKSNEAILRYVLHEPALKGEVPAAGELAQNNLCWSMPLLNDSGIVLFFLDSLDHPVSVTDWQLVALGIDEPSMTWVSDWLKNKLRDLERD